MYLEMGAPVLEASTESATSASAAPAEPKDARKMIVPATRLRDFTVIPIIYVPRNRSRGCVLLSRAGRGGRLFVQALEIADQIREFLKAHRLLEAVRHQGNRALFAQPNVGLLDDN